MQKKLLLDISKVYKDYDMGSAGKLTVLKDIDLQIYEGDFIAITGPSGSGKSTMMNIVGALDIPSKGTVHVSGKNISHMSESDLAMLRGQTIGFIFQQFNLVPTLTALENVMLPMEFIDMDSDIAEQRATKLLTDLGLGDRMHHKPNELSGGQQQRVAIARAMANNPAIILADEPTGNLDSKTGQYVMNFLHDLNKKEGRTVVLITHDLNLVKYAKRVVHLKDGVITSVTQEREVKRK